MTDWLLFPPGGVLLLGALGLLLWRRPPGLILLIAALGMLWFASTPATSFQLVDYLQRQHAAVGEAELAQSDAQAIVVLAAGRNNATPDLGHTVSRITLARVRYAAHLHHRTGLPVVATGGMPPDDGGEPAGQLMREILLSEFGVAEAWSEDTSTTTYENARHTRAKLAERGIDRVLLVTQAMHMPRSVEVFEALGFSVTPAPTDFVMRERGANRWKPRAGSLRDTSLALHEILGGHWYRWRYHGEE